MGQSVGPETNDVPVPPNPQSEVLGRLIGDPNECVARVENQRCKCLLDTGSQVTTLSYNFYKQYLPRVKLNDIENLVRVEAANGTTIPYLGYIEAELHLPGALPKSNGVYVSSLVLIVPDTTYNRRVPLCVGMNCIRECVKEDEEVFGSNLIQGSVDGISTAWQMVYSTLAGPNSSFHNGKLD